MKLFHRYKTGQPTDMLKPSHPYLKDTSRVFRSCKCRGSLIWHTMLSLCRGHLAYWMKPRFKVIIKNSRTPKFRLLLCCYVGRCTFGFSCHCSSYLHYNLLGLVSLPRFFTSLKCFWFVLVVAYNPNESDQWSYWVLESFTFVHKRLR
jgi:hypothetical protein